VGNYGLALKTIVDWLDGLLLENATVNDVREMRCTTTKSGK
jgi:hypothetical protein